MLQIFFDGASLIGRCAPPFKGYAAAFFQERGCLLRLSRRERIGGEVVIGQAGGNAGLPFQSVKFAAQDEQLFGNRIGLVLSAEYVDGLHSALKIREIEVEIVFGESYARIGFENVPGIFVGCILLRDQRLVGPARREQVGVTGDLPAARIRRDQIVIVDHDSAEQHLGYQHQRDQNVDRHRRPKRSRDIESQQRRNPCSGKQQAPHF